MSPRRPGIKKWFVFSACVSERDWVENIDGKAKRLTNAKQMYVVMVVYLLMKPENYSSITQRLSLILGL